jgi:hypothetical protein
MTQTENRPTTDHRRVAGALAGLTPLSGVAGAPPTTGTTGTTGTTQPVGAPAPLGTAPAAVAPSAGPGAVAPAAAVGQPAPVPVAADDTAWSTRFGAPNVGMTPLAVAVAGRTVYVGGDFAGPMAGMPEGTYHRVAAWDGVAWHALGEGLDGVVRSIAVVGDDVVVGGDFTVAGGKVVANRLARWDGTTWSAVSGGVSNSQVPSMATVNGLASDGGRLYVAGVFDSVGTGTAAVPARGFAVLDLGTGTWSSPDGGLGSLGGAGEGRAVAVLGGRVHVGGYFDAAGTVPASSFAALDPGSGTWTAFGDGIRNGEFVGSVDSLAVDEASGTVFVGGAFTAAGTVATSGVATLTGETWGTLGAFTRFGDAGTVGVFALAHAGGRLYAGGEFTTAGNAAASYWAVHDGTEWAVPGDGLDNVVRGLAAYGDDVAVVGDFQFSGPLRVTYGGVWTADGWQSFGQGLTYDPYADGNVFAVVPTGTHLVAGGYFDMAGPVPVGSVAAWTGTGWLPMAGGLRGVNGLATVYAMARLDDDVYATGSFATLDPATGTWTASGDGIRSGDFVGSVDSLAVDEASGTVFVGGAFTAAGPVATSGVATLTGDTWGTLGAFTRFGDAGTAGVFALAYAGGRLYAGGEFTTAGNAAASYWAVHDGTDWSVPGDGLDNVVRGLAAYGDDVAVVGDFQYSGALRVTYGGVWTAAGWQSFGQGLTYDPYADGNVFAVVPTPAGTVAAGYFDQAGPVPVGSVATWTGDRWDPMAGGLRGVNALATVYAMTRLGDDLYVTGSFATAGAGTAANIARWDGTSWSALGSGLNGTGYALAVLGGRLYVGGRFSAAGTTAANGVAAWDPATSTWSTVGNAPAYDDAVLGLAVIADRYLVIGGRFHALRAGGRDLVRGLNGLTAFDTQAGTTPDGLLDGYLIVAGVQQSSGTGTARALHVQDGDLVVGGTFDTAGVVQLADPPELGFSARNLAVWHFGGDGRWDTPGGTDEPVMALTTVDGTQVVVGGWFGAAGPIAASGVVSFEPATGTWTAFGSGVGPGERGVRHVEALAQDADHGLWVGGTFDTAGGAPSCALALWTATAAAAPGAG